MNFIKTKSFELAVYVKGFSDSSKLALVLPGKLDTKDYPHMRSHVDFLSSKGYLALSFDPPGTWESKGEISLYTTTNYLKAINELVNYYGNRPTLVIGHSRGGSLAMLSGTRNLYITHIVSIMSSCSFDSKIHGEYPDGEWKKRGYLSSKRDLPEDSNKYKFFKLPYYFLEDQIQYDMMEDLKKCKKPKAFIYGKKDTLVKPELVKKAYEGSATPKSIYALDSGHDYRYKKKLIDKVNNFVEDFLRK